MTRYVYLFIALCLLLGCSKTPTSNSSSRKTVVRSPNILENPQVKQELKAENLGWYSDSTRRCSFDVAEEVETGHFLLKTNVKAEYVQRYSRMLEAMNVGFETVFGKTQLKAPIEVWIYASRSGFRKAAAVPNAGAFFSPKNNRVTCFHGLYENGGFTRRGLGSQICNAMVHGRWPEAFNKLPAWLFHGLGSLLSNANYDGQKLVFTPLSKKLLSRFRDARKKQSFTLKELMSKPRDGFHGPVITQAEAALWVLSFQIRDGRDILMKLLDSNGSIDPGKTNLGGSESFAEWDKQFEALLQ